MLCREVAVVWLSTAPRDHGAGHVVQAEAGRVCVCCRPRRSNEVVVVASRRRHAVPVAVASTTTTTTTSPSSREVAVAVRVAAAPVTTRRAAVGARAHAVVAPAAAGGRSVAPADAVRTAASADDVAVAATERSTARACACPSYKPSHSSATLVVKCVDIEIKCINIFKLVVRVHIVDDSMIHKQMKLTKQDRGI